MTQKSVSLHLISMPWTEPLSTPVQLGVLKAYVKKALPEVKTRIYPAYLMIPFECAGGKLAQWSKANHQHEELLYFLLYFKRFHKRVRKRDLGSWRSLLKRASIGRKVSASLLRTLEKETLNYLEREVVPHLRREEVNVVGFSMSYYQNYASLFAALYLRELCPDHEIIFLFGGMGATFPLTHKVYRDSGLNGFFVIGEGEQRLVHILKLLGSHPDLEFRELSTLLHKPALGFLNIQGEPVQLIENSDPIYKRNPPEIPYQLANIEGLPQPDYDEYFDCLRRVSDSESIYAQMLEDGIQMLVEGSRGCFARCDFCSDNFHWRGFRPSRPEKVISDTLELRSRYGVNQVLFVDDVCDTWAGEYAKALEENGIVVPSFMDLRATHPEEFWTGLALSGMKVCLVGIESLSSGMLKAIHKGTTAIDNLRVMKYLSELRINSTSNLMTHHPRSTLADLAETKRVLSQIPHFVPFMISPFSLFFGSPLHRQLAAAYKEKVVPREKLPRKYKDFQISGEYVCPPESYADPRVIEEWDEFQKWYSLRSKKKWGHFSVFRLGKKHLKLVDSREEGQYSVHYLKDEDAVIYDLIHRGPALEWLTKQSGLDGQHLEEILARLESIGAILRVDEHVLALALRERSELVSNFYRARNANAIHTPGQNLSTRQDVTAGPKILST